jgi:Ni/Fe-hydrogenase 1 B-type cytochrome subunit
MKSRKEDLREVYVWELPVRIYHWLNALCIVVLCITGFLITNPPGMLSQAEASSSYWFGIVRFTHFVTAFVFLFNFIFRLYWGFVGNRYAKWRNYLMLTGKQWADFWRVVKTDVFLIQNKPDPNIGHNSLASLSYFILFLAFLLQCLTGFMLYSQTSTAFFPKFTWVIQMFGGDMNVRIIHRLLMWFFILFAVVHVYIVLYHDYISRHGLLSSIIGGWKEIPEEVAAADEKAERQEARQA